MVQVLLARPIQRRLFCVPFLRSHFHIHHTQLAARKVVHTFKLADIGEGITESVKEQSLVQSFDTLCEVQSDKASVEITSPFDGVVKQLLVQEGEVAKVGAGICLIEAEEEEEEEDHTSLSETKTSIESPAPSQSEETPLDPTNDTISTFPRTDNSLATPSVRHFARQQGVDIAEIAPGSGRDGRVLKADVEAFIARGSVRDKPVSLSVQAEENDAVVELGRTRYGMWKAMTQCVRGGSRLTYSSAPLPSFRYSTSLDLTRFHALLPMLNAHIPAHYLPSSTQTRSRISQMVNPSALYPAPAPPSTPESGKFAKLTYLPFLLKTLANSMMEWPLLRASITSGPNANAKPTLTVRPSADLTLALSTPTGLYTPTISSAHSLSMHSLASRVAHLAHQGRQVPCALTPKDMPKRGGTISVSNVGAIGKGEGASPVLVPGAAASWVWDVSDDVPGERRLKVDVSWSADHRVVEGAELAAFVETWRGWVENPERLIAEGV
ncbi:2-oxoacid dehydrogenases acyltransferase-domain-containing protein [Melanogaster broomeanus]|nr:2-oxoacid dehydrogenases acyltransferase-domain-containing protein [Melanogaster broomeanus]